MDRAGTGGGIAEPDLARELGVSRGHEGRHFLVADLDILESVRGLLQRHVQTAHAIAGVAVHAPDAPFLQAMPHELADAHAHGMALRGCTRTRGWRFRIYNVAPLATFRRFHARR